MEFKFTWTRDKKRKELDSRQELRKKRELQAGTCSGRFNSSKVTKLMSEGNRWVSDERTGSRGLELGKEAQASC